MYYCQGKYIKCIGNKKKEVKLFLSTNIELMWYTYVDKNVL